MTLGERLEQKGFERGMASGMKQGLEQGKPEEALKIAKNMLLKGATLDFTKEVTDLPNEILVSLVHNS